MYRTPVAGQATTTTVPALPRAVKLGSRTLTLVAVPVVTTRRTQPPPGMMSLPEMVSDAVGVYGAGVVPAATTDCAALSVMLIVPFRRWREAGKLPRGPSRGHRSFHRESGSGTAPAEWTHSSTPRCPDARRAIESAPVRLSPAQMPR